VGFYGIQASVGRFLLPQRQQYKEHIPHVCQESSKITERFHLETQQLDKSKPCFYKKQEKIPVRQSLLNLENDQEG
jgi:hypothetical protein